MKLKKDEFKTHRARAHPSNSQNDIDGSIRWHADAEANAFVELFPRLKSPDPNDVPRLPEQAELNNREQRYRLRMADQCRVYQQGIAVLGMIADIARE